ncbi:hypothetical protein [Flavobacterium adhaerens]|uniref:hypothetical protein n=1 Tax=Flavobacterium adhaerens TaxID=3149043 RepID=UPI0032B3FB91
MKDLKKYSNKTKAAFVLVIVMVIILLNNFNTLNNSKKTNENINAIYNDRLVVEQYIFQYANELHSIKVNAIQSQATNNQKHDEILIALTTIENLNELYLKTVLTSKEKLYFDSFMLTCKRVEGFNKSNNWSQIVKSCNDALQILKKLSQLQISEAKSKLDYSNAIYYGNISIGELEIALLVVLCGITTYLLMAKKNKIKVKIPDPPSMN